MIKLDSSIRRDTGRRTREEAGDANVDKRGPLADDTVVVPDDGYDAATDEVAMTRSTPARITRTELVTVTATGGSAEDEVVGTEEAARPSR